MLPFAMPIKRRTGELVHKQMLMEQCTGQSVRSDGTVHGSPAAMELIPRLRDRLALHRRRACSFH
jgi:hypothetical protein